MAHILFLICAAEKFNLGLIILIILCNTEYFFVVVK